MGTSHHPSPVTSGANALKPRLGWLGVFHVVIGLVVILARVTRGLSDAQGQAA